MSSNWSIDYSVSFSTATSAAPEPERRWAFDDCGMAPLDGTSVVVIARSSGRRAVVATVVFHAMMQCQEFAPHEQQLARIQRAFPNLRRGDIEEAIKGLKGAGLIIDQREVLDRLGAGGAPSDDTLGAEQVVVATCDRPELLRRLLQSCADNERDHGGRYHYLVIDDSREPRNIARNRQLVEDAGRDLRLSISYCGQGDAERLVGRIVDVAPELGSAARFLLLGEPEWRQTHGRSWNRALLLNPGRTMVKVDDDVLIKVCRPPAGEAPRCVVGGGPKRAYFLDQEDQWQAYLAAEPRDPFAEIGRLTGATLAESIAALAGDGGALLEGVGSRGLRDLSADSRVLLSGCGYIGDPGTTSNGWLYELGEEDRRMLVRSEQDYLRYKRDRNLWLGRRGATLSPGYALISGVTAIDNRAYIPPYFPLLRNEDYLFGSLLQFLHPRSVMLEYGWAVPHLPEPRRRWEADSAEVADSMGALSFVVSWLRRWRTMPESASSAGRERALVAALHDLVAVDERRLQGLVDEELLQFRAAKIRFRQEDLAGFANAPDYWRRDMERSIQNNQAAIRNPAPSTLFDLRDEEGAGSGLRRFRELFDRYAAALDQWGALREVAAQIAD